MYRAFALGIISVLSISACLFVLPPVQAAGEKTPVDYSGVYRAKDAELTLSSHPHYPKLEYIGMLLLGSDQRVYAVKFRNDPVKGCNGVAYDGNLGNQRAIELKLEGKDLVLRYYDGPTLMLKRVENPR